MTFVGQVYQRADAFLLGGRTSHGKYGEAVSDRGRGIRSRGERPPTMGTPNHRR
jgi:hypothetical protein